MKTTYTDEKFLEVLNNQRLSIFELDDLGKESYKEETFIQAIQTGRLGLSYISAENQTPEIQKAAIQRYPYTYRYAVSPTYEVSLFAVELDPSLLSKVPKAHRTEEMCDVAIEKSIQIRQKSPRQKVCSLSSIPKNLRTEERLKRFLILDGKALNQLDLKPEDEKELRQAIQTTPDVIEGMDLTTMKEEFISLALSLKGELLEIVPENCRTPEMIEIALKASPRAIDFIKQPTYRHYEILATEYPHYLSKYNNQVPLPLMRLAITNNPYAFNLETNGSPRPLAPLYVSALCNRTSKHGAPTTRSSYSYRWLMNHMPKDIQDEVSAILSKEAGFLTPTMKLDHWLLALSSPIEGSTFFTSLLNDASLTLQATEKIQLNQIMKLFLTDLNYERRVRYDGYKAKHRQAMIKLDGTNIRKFDLEHQTPKLVKDALNQTPKALKYIHPQFKDYRTCRAVVRECEEMKLYSPYHVETEIHHQLTLNPSFT